MTHAEKHFAGLFNRLTRECGKVDDTALTGIIGFTGGGPVSMCKVGDDATYVTVELSLNPRQQASAEGLHFELLCRGDLSVDTAHTLLTAVGGLSMNAVLGDGHTIDMSAAMDGSEVRMVRLALYSKVGIFRPKYGVYEVIQVQ
jgi:hypothetical protein